MTKQYRSRVMASIHETAEGLHTAGIVDKLAMRKFDKACLVLSALRNNNIGFESQRHPPTRVDVNSARRTP